MPSIYFAHPTTEYGTTVETVALNDIKAAFPDHDIVNPNSPEHEAAYKAQGMSYFVEMVKLCDTLVFMGFEDGAIGAGVAKEIGAALLYEKQVIGLSRDGDFFRFNMTVEETRARISDIRKARTGLVLPEGVSFPGA